MDVYFLNLNLVTDDQQLIFLFSQIQTKSLLIIEDIDCMSTMTHSRDTNNTNNKQNKFTLSCLLNCLDGFECGHARLCIMTSNNPECLDRALLRPGRCDRIFEFGLATPDIISRMYTLYFNKTPPTTLTTINTKCSPAEISKIFMINKNDSLKAWEECVQKTRLTN